MTSLLNADKYKNIIYEIIIILALLRITPLNGVGVGEIFLISSINYFVLFISILLFILRKDIHINNLYFCISVFVIIDYYINPTLLNDTLIRIGFLIVGYSYYCHVMDSQYAPSRYFYFVSFSIYSLQILYLYYLEIPNLDSYIAGWIYNGFDVGISKAQMSTLLAFVSIYIYVSRKYFLFFILILISWPILIESRSVISTTISILIIYNSILVLKRLKLGIFLAVIFLSLLVSYSLYVGKFDRLHSYMISFDLIKENIFGIGLRQYYHFASNNFDALNIKYHDYLNDGDVIYLGAESMFADMIATQGIFGIITLVIYFYIFLSSLKKYKYLNANELSILLIWGFLILIGIGSDHSHIDLLFFIIFGIVCGIKFKENSSLNKILC